MASQGGFIFNFCRSSVVVSYFQPDLPILKKKKNPSTDVVKGFVTGADNVT
jgi:hypothetical protein